MASSGPGLSLSLSGSAAATSSSSGPPSARVPGSPAESPGATPPASPSSRTSRVFSASNLSGLARPPASPAATGMSLSGASAGAAGRGPVARQPYAHHTASSSRLQAQVPAGTSGAGASAGPSGSAAPLWNGAPAHLQSLMGQEDGAGSDTFTPVSISSSLPTPFRQTVASDSIVSSGSDSSPSRFAVTPVVPLGQPVDKYSSGFGSAGVGGKLRGGASGVSYTCLAIVLVYVHLLAIGVYFAAVRAAVSNVQASSGGILNGASNTFVDGANLFSDTAAVSLAGRPTTSPGTRGGAASPANSLVSTRLVTAQDMSNAELQWRTEWQSDMYTIKHVHIRRVFSEISKLRNELESGAVFDSSSVRAHLLKNMRSELQSILGDLLIDFKHELLMEIDRTGSTRGKSATGHAFAPCSVNDLKRLPGGSWCRRFNVPQSDAQDPLIVVSYASDPTFLICLRPPTPRLSMTYDIWTHGVYDRAKASLFGRLLRTRKPSLVVDVGAHTGQTTLLMAVTGHFVVALEPSESNIRLLKRAAELNGVQDRIEVHHAAATDREHWMRVESCSPEDNCQLAPAPDGYSGTKVQGITLSSLITQESPPFVVKIGAEGLDYETVIGGWPLFQNATVPYVNFEWQPSVMERRGQDPVGFLQSMWNAGYRIVFPEYQDLDAEPADFQRLYDRFRTGHQELYLYRRGLCSWVAPQSCFDAQHKKQGMLKA